MPRKGKKKATVEDEAAAAAGEKKDGDEILMIPRFKNWRSMSYFQGGWFEKELEADYFARLAFLNYNTYRPWPIDPGVFYDLVKIRRSTDDAFSKIAQVGQGIRRGGFLQRQGVRKAGFWMSAKMAAKFEDQLMEMLSEAFRTEDIATSLLMHYKTALNGLENAVANASRRNPSDPDVMYAKFFCDKVNSTLEHFVDTPDPSMLDAVILGYWKGTDESKEAQAYRTRAAVHRLHENWQATINDINDAMYKLDKYFQRNHCAVASPASQDAGSQDEPPRKLIDVRDVSQDLVIPETHYKYLISQAGVKMGIQEPRCMEPTEPEEGQQPTSLRSRLLFDKANVHLDWAVKVANVVLDDEDETEGDRLRAHATLREYVKTARDAYMGFLSLLEYSPNYPHVAHCAFMSCARLMKSQKRTVDWKAEFGEFWQFKARRQWQNSPTDELKWGRMPFLSAERQDDIKRYPVSSLFQAKEETGLPPFPPRQEDLVDSQFDPARHETMEVVTFHPFLVEALHCLLICHVLLQTSPTELARHANMVGRLSRLATGFPILRLAASPASADWSEIMTRFPTWLDLTTNRWALLTSGMASAWTPPSPSAEKGETGDTKAAEQAVDPGQGTRDKAMIALVDNRLFPWMQVEWDDARQLMVQVVHQIMARGEEIALLAAYQESGLEQQRSLKDESVRRFPSLPNFEGGHHEVRDHDAGELVGPPGHQVFIPYDMLETRQRYRYPIVTRRGAVLCEWIEKKPKWASSRKKPAGRRGGRGGGRGKFSSFSSVGRGAEPGGRPAAT
ncbi:hypothetical protein MKZ38_000252 [Zalerion maritima]|uniref:Uncharacterized protein n=1 Tax=Zalerion maritima TaxID=339359 RepID=A0AAD5RT44_9PEZI|nr:hypothetical protein MKZ38_000252 [Zalerion maritima]